MLGSSLSAEARQQMLKLRKEIDDGLYRQTARALHGSPYQQSGLSSQGAIGQTFANQYASAATQQSLAYQTAQQQAYAAALQSGLGGVIYDPYLDAFKHVAVARSTTEYPPVKYTGIRVGEITAWRTWAIVGGWLKSASADVIWAPGEPMEGDTKTHGCYAYKAKRDAIKHMVKETGGVGIVGSVALWGSVVEHEIGYRAQFAKIVSLDFIDNGTDDDLQRMRVKYGVA